MSAIIYRPAKNQMQSGKLSKNKWILKFVHDGSSDVEPLMKWISSGDTKQEVIIKFETLDQAINFAKNNKIDYEILAPNEEKLHKRSYADNFKKVN